MAAGRHGGYRDNEFRVRESDLKLMRRKDFYCPRQESQESDRYRKGGDPDGGGGEGRREIVRSKERDATENFTLIRRKKDIAETEAVKGGHNLNLINNNPGFSGGLSDTTAKREPGELVTGIGSDDDTFFESQVRDNEVSMSENGVQSPARKKRRFSPIVWDREEKKEVGSSFSNRIVPTTSTIPPLRSEYCRHSPNLCAQISPIRPDGFHVSQLSVAKPMVKPCSGGWVVGEPKTGLYSSSSQEQLRSSDHELGQLEAVDIVPRNEDVVYDEEDMLKRRKKMTGPQPVETDSKEKIQSFEQGELTGDRSEGIRTKSSETVEDDSYDGSAGKGEYPDNEFMDMDKNGSTTVHYSDTDSEGGKCSCNPVEQVIAQPRSIDMLKGCRSVHEFERLNKIDEGTYGVVYRARDKKTGEVVALKKVKMEREREGFPLTSLREINILLSSNHPSIVDVKEVVMGDLDSIFMVMEYMDHDLKGLMETQRQPFSQSEVKCLMLQLLEGVKYLHDNWVLHRDLKTSNILFNNRGELKICDFGMSRQYGSPLKPYTQLVVTLWYRAPELLLGAKQYSTAIDMWSLGCIMAELLAKEPLFNGKTEIEQIDKIFRTLGTPSETVWPGFSKLPGVKVNFVEHRYNLLRKKFPPTSFTGSPVLSGAGFDLLNRLLTYDPEKRITAEDAVNHEWFREVPLPKSKDFMPTFPAQHEQDRRLRRIMKSPDPLEEQRIRELRQGELGSGGLFG